MTGPTPGADANTVFVVYLTLCATVGAVCGLLALMALEPDHDADSRTGGASLGAIVGAVLGMLCALLLWVAFKLTA